MSVSLLTQPTADFVEFISSANVVVACANDRLQLVDTNGTLLNPGLSVCVCQCTVGVLLYPVMSVYCRGPAVL